MFSTHEELTQLKRRLSQQALETLQRCKNIVRDSDKFSEENKKDMIEGFTILQSVLSLIVELPSQFNTIQAGITACIGATQLDAKIADKLITNFIRNTIAVYIAKQIIIMGDREQ